VLIAAIGKMVVVGRGSLLTEEKIGWELCDVTGVLT